MSTLSAFFGSTQDKVKGAGAATPPTQSKTYMRSPPTGSVPEQQAESASSCGTYCQSPPVGPGLISGVRQ